MPFYEADSEVANNPQFTHADPVYTFGELFGAAASGETTVGNAVTGFNDMVSRNNALYGQSIPTVDQVTAGRVPGYDPISDPQTYGYEDYARDYLSSGSPQETALHIARINRNLERSMQLSEGGWTGFAAQLTAGALDPINLVPFGIVSKGAEGATMLRTAREMAGYGLATAIPMEAVAREAQGSTRTNAESLMNIGTQTLFMAAMGTGLHWLGSAVKPEEEAIVGRTLKEWFTDLHGEPVDRGGTPQSAGAAANTDRATLADLEAKSAFGAQRLIGGDGITGTPLGQLGTSPSREARIAGTTMAEDALRRAGEERGIAANTAVETIIKYKYMASMVRTLEGLMDGFLKYRGKADTFLNRTGLALTDARSDVQTEGARWDGSSPMTFAQFRTEVGHALLDNEQHAVPEVAAEAQKVRKLFDMIKNEAIDVGLLDKDVKTEVADSYLTRLWKPAVVESKRGEFTQILRDYFLKEAKEAQARDPKEVEGWKTRHDNAKQAEAEVQKFIDLQAKRAELARKNMNTARRGLQGRIGFEAALKRVVERLEKELNFAKTRADYFRTTGKFQDGDPILEALNTMRDVARGRLKEPIRIVDRIRELGGIKLAAEEAEAAGLKSNKYRRGVVSDEGKTPEEMIGILQREGWFDRQTEHEISLDGSAEKEDLLELIKRDTSEKTSKSKTAVYNVMRDGETIQKFNEGNEMLTEMEQVGAHANMRDDEILYRLGAIQDKPATAVNIAHEQGADFYLKKVQQRYDQTTSDLNAVKKKLDEQSAEILAHKENRDLADGEVKALTKERTAYRNVIKHYGALYENHNVLIGKDNDSFDDIIGDVINNITANNGEGMHKPIPGLGRSLKDITLKIGTKAVLPFVEMDIAKVLKSHVRQMSADIEMQRAFGDTTLEQTFDAIKADYKNLQDEVEATIREKFKSLSEEKLTAKIEKEHRRLAESQRKDLAAMTVMRERIQGRRGLPENPKGLLHRTLSTARAYNVLRLGGSFALASIPDMGSIVMTHGMAAVFGRKGLLGLMTGLKAVKMNIKEAKYHGAGLEYVMESFGHGINDIADHYGANTMFERGVHAASQKSGLITGMSMWNAAMKQWSGAVSIARTADALIATLDGTITKNEALRLRHLGINEIEARQMAEMMQKHGEHIDGVWSPHTERWADANGKAADRLRDLYAHSMTKDVDFTIVTPGAGDKPAWMDANDWTKAIGQFRSFFLSSMTRITVRGLQQADTNALQGLALMTTLGAMVYYIRTPSDKISHDPLVFVKEGVDRAGVTGWLFEVNNMLEKATGNQLGLSAMLGQRPSQRYASRGFVGNVLGPTVGLLDTAAGLSAASASGDFTDADYNNLSRAAPLWNTFYLKWMRDAFENDGTDEEGQRQ